MNNSAEPHSASATEAAKAMHPSDVLALAMRALPEVEQARSRFSRAGLPAWCVKGREFAHLHALDRLDLRLPGDVQQRARQDPRARFRRSRSAWVEFEFHDQHDVDA